MNIQQRIALEFLQYNNCFQVPVSFLSTNPARPRDPLHSGSFWGASVAHTGSFSVWSFLGATIRRVKFWHMAAAAWMLSLPFITYVFKTTTQSNQHCGSRRSRTAPFGVTGCVSREGHSATRALNSKAAIEVLALVVALGPSAAC